MLFEGTYTALVTPFADDAARTIDWKAYEALLESQVAGGVQGVVPLGTTGESPTLTETEQHEVVRRTLSIVRGRVQVIVGVGSNSTAHTVHLAQAAEKAGADAVMAVVPYYNKPSQEGLLEHFVTIAKAVGLPVVTYNVPGRSVADLHADTLLQLLDRAANVVATKEATGNVLRAQELVRRAGDRLAVLSGDDALTLPMIAVGARGVISVTSNLLPGDVAVATRLALEGKHAEARRAHFALLPLHEAMFLEPNPSPVKAALAMQDIGNGLTRLPLLAASAAVRERLSTLLALRAGRA